MLLEHLPAGSATVAALAPESQWGSLEARILAAIFHLLTGKPYPELERVMEAGRAAEVADRLERWRERHPGTVREGSGGG